MYSYEDRIRAVKLFIKLGKRTGPTIRQFGFPTKNALKSWCREYERSRDLQVVYVRSRQKYSEERKQAAVQHYLDAHTSREQGMLAAVKEGQHSLTAVANHVKLSISRVSRIVQQAGRGGVMAKGKTCPRFS